MQYKKTSKEHWNKKKKIMAYYSQGHFVKKKKKCVERGQELRLGNTVSRKAAKRGRGGASEWRRQWAQTEN